MGKEIKLVFIFLLLPWLSSGQTDQDSIFQLQDGLNEAEITFKFPIAKNLSLHNGIGASYINSLREINFPVFLQYNISDTFQLQSGVAYKYEVVDGFMFPNGVSNSGIHGQIGIRYNFNERVFGRVMFQKSLNKQSALNFGNNPSGNIKFSTGFSF